MSVNLSISKAFELREQLKRKTENHLTYGQKQVIESILYGHYDSYKEDKLEIALDDVKCRDGLL